MAAGSTKGSRSRNSRLPADEAGPLDGTPCLRWVCAISGADVRLIPSADILYFRSDTKYTRVVARDQEALIRASLDTLEAELDPAVFCRVHRSVIVNLNAIATVHHNGDGRTVLRLKGRDEVLPVSHRHTRLFRPM